MRERCERADRRARRAAAADRRRRARGGQGVPALAGRRPLHVPRLPRVRASREQDGEAGSKCDRRLRPRDPARARRNAATRTLAPKALALARAPHPLVLTKANSRATVHRPAYLDYIGVKRFDADGEVIGERRFLGLYTTAAYKASPREIPLLRGRSRRVLERAGLPARQPRRQGADRDPRVLSRATRCSRSTADELFDDRDGDPRARASASACGCSSAATRSIASSRAWSASRATASTPRTASGSGGSCSRRSAASHLDWTLQLSESLLARVHYIVHCPRRGPRGLRRRARSRPGSSRRPGRGPTTCARR